MIDTSKHWVAFYKPMSGIFALKGVYMDRLQILILYLKASDEIKNQIDEILKESESQIELLDSLHHIDS